MRNKLILFLMSLFILCSCRKEIRGPLFPISENGLWGFIDSSGTALIKPQFKAVRDFKQQRAWVQTKEEEWRCLDPYGEFILESVFDSVRELHARLTASLKPSASNLGSLSENITDFALEISEDPDVFIYEVSKHGKCGAVSASGRLLLPTDFESVSCAYDNLMLVRTGDRYGFADTTGHLVIPAQYDTATDFACGHAWVRIKDHWSVIDQSGKNVWTPSDSFLQVTPFYNGYALVSKTILVTRTHMWGAAMERPETIWQKIDTTGKPYPLEADKESSLLYGWSLNHFYDYSIGAGDTPIPPVVYHYLVKAPRRFKGIPEKNAPGIINLSQYGSVRKISDQLLLVTQLYAPNKWKILRVYSDSVGSAMAWNDYEREIQNFSEGLALVSRIDWIYVMTIDPRQDIPPFSKRQWGAIDTLGQWAVPVKSEYKQVFSFHDGVAKFQAASQKFGFVDKKFDVLHPAEFDDVSDYRDGICFYKLDQHWGLMDLKFKKITEPLFDAVAPFQNPLAKFLIGDRWGYVNRQGRIVWKQK